MTPKELRQTYRAVLMSEDGEKVIEDLSARFGLYTSSFTPNSDETAFREGQRDVVLFLLSMTKDQKPKE
jgi:predicted oxidoreductase (fatty acid repression mutant protein)|tara:strand:- start:157 stop:363 length:207 start_codon:yes stop_codon:yes gene_type:complete